jgi:hypothetical protein
MPHAFGKHFLRRGATMPQSPRAQIAKSAMLCDPALHIVDTPILQGGPVALHSGHFEQPVG